MSTKMAHQRTSKHVVMYNSPASYNTCLISSLYIGMVLEMVNVDVAGLFDRLFECISMQKFGEPLDLTLKGPGSSSEIEPDDITRFLNIISIEYDISIDIYGIFNREMFSYGNNMYITNAAYYEK